MHGLKHLEDGIHTYDIFKDTISKQKVGTKEFAQAVVQRLGQQPEKLKAVHYEKAKHVHQAVKQPCKSASSIKKELVGVDVFIQWDSTTEELAAHLTALDIPKVKLKFISNRGVRIWPTQLPETLCSDCYRCRFSSENKDQPLSYQQVTVLLQAIANKNLEIAQATSLFLFDGQRGFTALQDE